MELFGYRVFECELTPVKHITDGSVDQELPVITKRIVSRHWLEGMQGCRIRTKKINNDYHFGTKVVRKRKKQKKELPA
jgi:hypothetical protein